MKSALILLAVLFSTQSFAASVGDKALYNVTTQGVAGTIAFEIVSINAGQATYTQTINIQGQTQTQNQTQPVAELDSYAQIVASCSTIGGTITSISVAAGTFSACHLVQNNNGASNDMYIAGNVPFGIVKLTTASGGASTSLELNSFIKH